MLPTFNEMHPIERVSYFLISEKNEFRLFLLAVAVVKTRTRQ